jgi:hypothetical protein
MGIQGLYSFDPMTTETHWGVKKMFQMTRRLLAVLLIGQKAKAGELKIRKRSLTRMPMVVDQEVGQTTKFA